MKIFKNDFIVRYLHFCSSLNIYFSSNLVSSPRLTSLSPLYYFFLGHAALYASQVQLFKKYSLHFLRDCISSDGLIFDHYPNIIRHHSSLMFRKIPKWHSFLSTQVTVTPNSLRLQDRFVSSSYASSPASIRLADADLPLSTLVPPKNLLSKSAGVLLGI